MRDPGLEEAVRAVGGVSELARQIGISQPSVSNWNRVPAERVLIVEAATGVDRKVLRPDLYRERRCKISQRPTMSPRRARRNTRCSPRCSARAPDAKLLKSLAGLRGDATPLGVAHAALAQAASETTVERVEREYLQSVHRARPRRTAALRLVLSHRLPARAPAGAAARRSRRRSASSAPKATASRRITPRRCARSWRGSSSGRLPAPQGTDQQIFEKHLAPWIGRFFADLERAEAANFYRRIGTLGRVFMEVETEAFALPS